MQTLIPHPYQEEAIQGILAETYRKEWFFPGEGKTIISLEAFRRLKEMGVVKKALIIAPKTVMEDTWPKEIAKWDRFQGLTYTILSGPKKDELIHADTDIYLINFEGLKWLLKAMYTSQSKRKSTRALSMSSDKLYTMGVDMLIIDELSKCKDSASMQARLIYKIAPMFKRRVGLTATPNNLMDVFSQTKCLDLGNTFSPSITKYRKTYFDREISGGWKLKDGVSEEIYAQLAPMVSQRKHRQLDGLPVLTHTHIPVAMPDKARLFYNKLKKDFIASFENKEIDAFNAGVKTLKLRQIASGGLYFTEPEAKAKALKEFMELKILPSKNASRETLLIHDAKSQALASLIDDLNGQPLLVFYAFNHDIDNIKSVLGKDIPVLNEMKNKPAVMKEWNEGKIPVLLLHAKSAAHGLNLQYSGGHICWYTLEWSHEIREQGVGRIWRQGNPAPETRVYYLLSEGTIDYHVLETVERKESIQNELFEGVKRYYEFLKKDDVSEEFMGRLQAILPIGSEEDLREAGYYDDEKEGHA